MSSVDSTTLARTVAAALIEGGMREAVICPGSRSAPLVYALAEHERAGRLRLHVRIDERSAGFLAHGLSLSTGRPVGVLTTSGTAVGNLLPAVMEAFHAGTRLVALTADRPAELHGTGANQTTVQEGLFARHTRAAASVDGDPAPGVHADEHLRAVSSAVRGALLRADGFAAADAAVAVAVAEAPAGPVHLNLRFRDPLVPDADQLAEMAAVVPAEDAGPDDPRLPWRAPGMDLSGGPELDVSRRDARCTVVLACHGAGPVAAAFAVSLGLPLLAEPSSDARFSVNAIAAYPLLLGPGGGTSPRAHPLAARIERVVLFGRPTLTRPVTALLRRPDVETALFAPEPAPWFEPGRRAERMIADPAELAAFAGQGRPGWLVAWQRASMRAQAALEDVLARRDRDHGLSPQSVAHVVPAVTRGPLVLGSSSLIRDVDLTWRPPAAPDVQVFANRGLAGIDGTIATAAGVALGTGRRTVALVGDLTALHDSGGLLQGPGEPEPDLDVVVVNDAGGAIFAGLEHGQVARAEGMADTVERFFGTPHTVDFAALAAAHGLAHVPVDTRVGLVHTLSDPVRGRRLVEVRCDRADRPGVTAAIAEAVAATFEAAPECHPDDLALTEEES
ncbi:2-succinyl-5-enolpyruvyl-6-hydroxy-3-cyclohexene-1-carboxylic-acid synthase [Micrococcus flavus]|uniref:2-succinyl-5-enolpyruvyl-6-hydroxy-3-cyclohexene-1-carboxylate synthase n=1 Tax=Micrococcus flavus TaxID=384602 RepID=A0A4Y8X3H7_9MICC|nr:2-succinyl-5-enolpyruvyl-6-hydroxy-3-cyclohexene-1-carboxylic-acid synthase [Micrococcus flavus]MBB4882089.1 2-succinyl-5-enolpyruvyl-6-hydroxy-3-cyclohexene-1-carboxylate synthase [Micrococcus flavus]TFI03976.1 2-succinyl-5-enolpyruvyl-6-hydroxy-3-cyclohexene-1-carboxylic-acid synthase [Micrococcus flavus]GGK50219.1 2-succinyl-5-enolpyruvyl-6-hydroxy-3-cyclohexene-1-carboxylate synthase [Micrococcus flavus]